MKLKNTRILLWILGLCLVAYRAYNYYDRTLHNNRPIAEDTRNRKENLPTNDSNSGNRNSSIPDKVYKILDYINKNHQAPDGYVGGRHFGNFENILPKKDNSGRNIDYQEWDVNPKTQGKNRGVERLVTGSNHKAWYTHDHYKHFDEVK